MTEQTANVNSISRISEGTVVKGQIGTGNDIRVDGVVEGKITASGRVVVGESASIKGTIVCANLDLWGKVEGDLYVKEVLSVKGTAEIAGNVYVRKFQVEMGARFNGVCKMITEEDFDKMDETQA
ncbi:MAG: polymer-forming cytoskeletal protein [Bacteroidales bacterium]|nr:polymer-forming cytoskeletal protein [Bacteroidales bacterium]